MRTTGGKGILLMWDNCLVQHRAVSDYALPLRRLMHRTTVAGSQRAPRSGFELET